MSAGSMLLLTGLLLVVHAIYSGFKIALSDQEQATIKQAALMRFNLIGGFSMFGLGAMLMARL